jgi:hypothetical protein
LLGEVELSLDSGRSCRTRQRDSLDGYPIVDELVFAFGLRIPSGNGESELADKSFGCRHLVAAVVN